MRTGATAANACVARFRQTAEASSFKKERQRAGEGRRREMDSVRESESEREQGGRGAGMKGARERITGGS